MFQYKRGSQGSLDLSSEADGIDLLCQVEAKPKAANYRWAGHMVACVHCLNFCCLFLFLLFNSLLTTAWNQIKKSIPSSQNAGGYSTARTPSSRSRVLRVLWRSVTTDLQTEKTMDKSCAGPLTTWASRYWYFSFTFYGNC